MRGPPPKPTALRIAEGNPGKRPLPDAEPKPTGKAQCPAYLSLEAQKVWAVTAPLCESMGTLTEADVDQFASYCMAMGAVREMNEDIKENGYTDDTDIGGTKKRPAVAIMQDYQRIGMQIGARFGLTPSDRTRISVGKQDDEDPFAKLAGIK